MTASLHIHWLMSTEVLLETSLTKNMDISNGYGTSEVYPYMDGQFLLLLLQVY